MGQEGAGKAAWPAQGHVGSGRRACDGLACADRSCRGRARVIASSWEGERSEAVSRSVARCLPGRDLIYRSAAAPHGRPRGGSRRRAHPARREPGRAVGGDAGSAICRRARPARARHAHRAALRPDDRRRGRAWAVASERRVAAASARARWRVRWQGREEGLRESRAHRRGVHGLHARLDAPSPARLSQSEARRGHERDERRRGVARVGVRGRARAMGRARAASSAIRSSTSSS